MRVRANGLSLPDLDTLAALETGRFWTPAKRPGEPLYRPASNNGYWAEDILTNGLVLYVPLWLYSGAKFPSVDTYKHTCTVAGATWGLQGRTFDGTNDIIGLLTYSAATDLAATFTIELWFKSSETRDYKGLLGKYKAGGGDSAIGVYRPDSNILRLHLFDGTNYKSLNCAVNVWTGNWFHAVLSLNALTGQWYINGAAVGAPIVSTITPYSGAGTELWTIGRTSTTDIGSALIGEVRIYNRALSAQEVLHNYKVTRGRYA